MSSTHKLLPQKPFQSSADVYSQKYKTELNAYTSNLRANTQQSTGLSNNKQVTSSLKNKAVDDSSEVQFNSMAVPINEQKMRLLHDGIMSVKLGSYKNYNTNPTNYFTPNSNQVASKSPSSMVQEFKSKYSSARQSSSSDGEARMLKLPVGARRL